MTSAQTYALGSILIGMAVLALKTAAWWLTGSAALYSDALESIVNVAASVVALLALRFAERPADANHPYGHDKAEFFAAVIEGVMIVIAALAIFQEAWRGWNAPRDFALPIAGLALNAAATLANGFWAWMLLRAGKRLRSPVLEGDGWHLVSDVVTSGAIAVGFGIAAITGLRSLDPLLAAGAGVYVLWAGATLIRRSLGGLMDMAPDTAIIRRIEATIAANSAGTIEAHDLRARFAGRLIFLDFHLVVPGAMPVRESHAICDRIEAALKAEMPHLAIVIHVEPEDKAERTAAAMARGPDNAAPLC